MDTCSICLDDINENDKKYTLSCNHVFHFSCFRDYAFNKNTTFYKPCPNCKQLNLNIDKSFDSVKDNLLAFCTFPKRCNCKNSKGLKCKHKPYLFNYGMCYNHNKDIIKDDKMETLLLYINHLMQADMRSWSTKVTLIDVVKKLLLKFDNIKGLEDIYSYMFMFMADAKHNGINNYFTEREILYGYYDLEVPPQEWLETCVDKRILF